MQTEEDIPVASPPPFPGMPRWVRTSGIICAGVMLLIVILILAGGGLGRHGPGRHLTSGVANDQNSSASAEDGPTAGDSIVSHAVPEGNHR